MKQLLIYDLLIYFRSQPKIVIDAATLTGAMAVAIGGAASGVYSTNEKYWDLMNRASFNTGDRVWRMPLWNYYLEKMKSKNKDKTSNVGYMKPLNGTPGFENLIEALNYLNNYFDFHVCLSIRGSGSRSGSGSVRPKTNFYSCKCITKCHQ